MCERIKNKKQQSKTEQREGVCMCIRFVCMCGSAGGDSECVYKEEEGLVKEGEEGCVVWMRDRERVDTIGDHDEISKTERCCDMICIDE